MIISILVWGTPRVAYNEQSEISHVLDGGGLPPLRWRGRNAQNWSSAGPKILHLECFLSLSFLPPSSTARCRWPSSSPAGDPGRRKGRPPASWTWVFSRCSLLALWAFPLRECSFHHACLISSVPSDIVSYSVSHSHYCDCIVKADKQACPRFCSRVLILL